MNISESFELGSIITESSLESAKKANFVSHKSFRGVSLKLLVGGGKTGNALSLHLVRVEPHCCLEHHVHPENLEMHEVIGGNGTVIIGGSSGEYRAGTVGVIPAGITHKVTAGEEGLYILATFSPALA